MLVHLACKMIFENRFITPEATVAKAIWSAREWNTAQPTAKVQPQRIRRPLITPDLEDLIVCCSDEAWKSDSKLAAFGCIFMDRQGSVIYQSSRVEENIPSAQVAEALVLRWALLRALSLGYSKICFNTDCQSLISAITSTAPPADPYGIILDIEHLSLSFCSVSFNFLARRFYSTADSLAKACRLSCKNCSLHCHLYSPLAYGKEIS